jgi:SAM-dependent methyltransferase
MGYRSDLAYIHDRGFSKFSLDAFRGLVKLFRNHRLPGKQIVELGCGSGRLAHALVRQGFSVTGFDSSRAMIALAKRNAPGGLFHVKSFWSCTLPPAAAVLSVGEALNYQFNGPVSLQRIRRLFERIYDALAPSGLFVFDLLCEQASKKILETKSFVEGAGWLVAVDKTDGPDLIVRRITTFRRTGRSYRRSAEVHTVHRYNLSRISSSLRSVGFTVSVRNGYGTESLGAGHVVVVGRKPGHRVDKK